MNVIRIAVARPLALALLAACGNAASQEYQGWVEADLIFVSPDEPGRDRDAGGARGRRVETGAPLFTLDPDLQHADLAIAEASLTNAQAGLRARAGAHQDRFRHAAGDRRCGARCVPAQARLNSAQTRLARRKVASPVAGTVQQIYYRPGEIVPAGRPVVALLPPGNIKVRFFVPEAMLPRIALGDRVLSAATAAPAI